MEFTYIFILVTAVYLSLLGIVIIKTGDRKKVLTSMNEDKSFIQDFIDKKELEIRRSRVEITIRQYMLLLIIAPVFLATVFFIFMPSIPILSIAGAVAGFYIPELWLKYMKSKEEEGYSEKFSKALNQMSASLTSKMSFEKSIEAVTKSELIDGNVKTDFKQLLADINVGIPVVKAFEKYAEFTENEDVRDTATAVSIMLELGKDEGEGIKKIQKNIEDRMLYRKQRKAMMTESKILVYTADFIPVLVLLIMMTTSKGTMEYYFSDIKMTVIFLGMIVWVLIGSVVIHKLMGETKDIS